MSPTAIHAMYERPVLRGDGDGAARSEVTARGIAISPDVTSDGSLRPDQGS